MTSQVKICHGCKSNKSIRIWNNGLNAVTEDSSDEQTDVDTEEEEPPADGKKALCIAVSGLG